MDWVHCNNCFFLPGMGKRFFLTSCGHIYCGDCIRQCATDHCKLCGNTCSSIPLSSQMKPEVEMYFSDPLELLKKYLKEIQKVAEFQSSHRARLFTYLRDKAKKTQLLKDEFKKTQVKLKECESENQLLKNQIDRMKQMLNMNQYDGSEMSTSARSESYNQTPYLQKGDTFENTTPMSKWSQASSSCSRNRSDGSTTSSYPAMPARVTVRTPPFNGKLGVIPGTPMSSGINLQNFRLSGQMTDPDVTPKVVRSAYISPMSVSPCSSVASVSRYQDFARSSTSCGSFSRPNNPQLCLSDAKSVTGSHLNSVRQIKLPLDMKSYGSIKTLAVPPYSPDTLERAKKT